MHRCNRWPMFNRWQSKLSLRNLPSRISIKMMRLKISLRDLPSRVSTQRLKLKISLREHAIEEEHQDAEVVVPPRRNYPHHS